MSIKFQFDPIKLRQSIDEWAKQLGFQQVGISNIDLTKAGKYLTHWLDKKFHGEMDYMARHGNKRTQPDQLVPGTISIISLRMDYLPETQQHAIKQLKQNNKAYISRYALGRDYHKLIRQRLKKLADKISAEVSGSQFRVFTDSAPVLEKAIAEKADLGWIGKHTNLINRNTGSWFFLGEIYTNIPLAIDSTKIQSQDHCGRCTQCMDVCPTQAIIAPYVLDARKCISYLNIELKGSIPIKYRRAIGNRIYGCDDCQLFCPWNKFTLKTREKDFYPRHELDQATLIDLFQWSEGEFLARFTGSAIRRIGYQSWQRNISIALGNYLYQKQDKQVIKILRQKKQTADEVVTEHINWALNNLSALTD